MIKSLKSLIETTTLFIRAFWYCNGEKKQMDRYFDLWIHLDVFKTITKAEEETGLDLSNTKKRLLKEMKNLDNE